MHALAQSRTRRSLMIIIGFALALAGVIAARYALLPLIWHHAAMHYHGHPTRGLAMHYHAHHLARVIAMHFHGIVTRMHYFG